MFSLAAPRRMCRAWNQDRDHQRAAGKARAARFTHDHQVAAGNAAWAAFSARWRAHQGLAPLDAESARRYLTVEDVRHLSRPVARPLAELILQAWCAGDLRGVEQWLALEDDELPPDPHGLWALADVRAAGVVPSLPSLERVFS